MGEIRIVGPGKTRGYPYPVCKKRISLSTGVRDFSISACYVSLGSESCLNLSIIA